MRAFSNLKASIANYKTLDSKDKKTFWKEGFINNLMYILIIIAAIYTYTQNHKFLSVSSIVNIISLSAANIPIALGIAGCIVLTGTDLSAGRVVGLTACISGIFTAVYGLCNKDVPESSATANPGSNPDRYRCWWYRRFRQWMVRSTV